MRAIVDTNSEPIHLAAEPACHTAQRESVDENPGFVGVSVRLMCRVW